MSQVPPPPPTTPPPLDVPQPYAPPPAPRTNVFGILSLIFGCLGCIPLLGGFLALLFGVLGIRQSRRDPRRRGEGLAIAGLVLGVISLVLWVGFGGLFVGIWVKSGPAVQLTRTFITDLSTGNVVAAASSADPAALPPAKVATLSQKVSGWGGLADLSVTSRNWSNGVWVLGGTATFHGAGTRSFTARVQHVNGMLKVTDLRFE